MPTKKLLYTVRESSHLLGVSERTVTGMIARNEIESVKLGRSRRIPWSSLESVAHGKAIDIAKLVSDASNAGVRCKLDGNELLVDCDISNRVQQSWFELLETVESRVIEYLRAEAAKGGRR